MRMDHHWYVDVHITCLMCCARVRMRMRMSRSFPDVCVCAIGFDLPVQSMGQ
jgi:hypothetical protein